MATAAVATAALMVGGRHGSSCPAHPELTTAAINMLQNVLQGLLNGVLRSARHQNSPNQYRGARAARSFRGVTPPMRLPPPCPRHRSHLISMNETRNRVTASTLISGIVIAGSVYVHRHLGHIGLLQ